MADVLKRMYGPAQPGTSAATVYTSPATGAVIRNIHVNNTTATAATFNLSIGTDAAATELYTLFNVPANSAYDWSGMIVLGNAEIVQMKQATASALTATISGVET